MKPTIIWGQDEVLFHRYSLMHKYWVGPNKERPLLTKREARAKIISSLKCRSFGTGGQKCSQSMLEEVNRICEGNQYTSKAAALCVHNKIAKGPLKESPFRRMIDVGVNRDGYWNYMEMAIQLEDCADRIGILYPMNLVRHILLVDQSAYHITKKEMKR